MGIRKLGEGQVRGSRDKVVNIEKKTLIRIIGERGWMR